MFHLRFCLSALCAKALRQEVVVRCRLVSTTGVQQVSVCWLCRQSKDSTESSQRYRLSCCTALLLAVPFLLLLRHVTSSKPATLLSSELTSYLQQNEQRYATFYMQDNMTTSLHRA